MRKVFLALAAMSVSMCGCRWCGDHPSHHYHRPPAAVLIETPNAAPVR